MKEATIIQVTEEAVYEMLRVLELIIVDTSKRAELIAKRRKKKRVSARDVALSFKMLKDRLDGFV